MRLLLIEDNARLAALIDKGLEATSFEVDRFERGEDGLAALDCVRYDAVILDLGLPDCDGLDILRTIRAQQNPVPVLILTSRILVSHRVEGLNAGADDYLTKPFAMEELVARLQALLRRPSTTLGSSFSVGNLTFNTDLRDVRVQDSPVKLTRRESGLLEQLIRHEGKVTPKQLIEDSLYGLTGTLSSNSVEVLVHRLRKKLASAGASVGIHTIHGVGYILIAEDS
jgi:DNA-binding response OmpR family regulator